MKNLVDAPICDAALRQDAKTIMAKDDAIAQLIGGLTALSAQARFQGLGTAARILATAKEDLVYWAAELNFHESPQERFINGHLYGSDPGEEPGNGQLTEK